MSDFNPEDLHPGVKVSIERLGMDELGVAKAIRDGELTSPQRYENVTLFAIRITGTGTAFRTKLNEHVYRAPELYLNQEFLERCNGLPVVWEHPETGKLNSKEFADRIVGTVLLPYIKGEEVWAIAKIYDDAAAKAMESKQLSTSPAVVFKSTDGNVLAKLKDGSSLLVEGKPSLLDHIAICEEGVWDKGRAPAGVELPTTPTEGSDMPEMEERHDAAENIDKLLKGVDALCGRLDAMEKRMDSMMRYRKADDDDDDDDDDVRRARKDDDDDDDDAARHHRKDDDDDDDADMIRAGSKKRHRKDDDDDDDRKSRKDSKRHRKDGDESFKQWAEEEGKEMAHKKDSDDDDDDDDDDDRKDAMSNIKGDDDDDDDEAPMKEEPKHLAADRRHRKDDDDDDAHKARKHRKDDDDDDDDDRRSDSVKRMEKFTASELRRLSDAISRMPKSMSDADYALMADYQAKADSVYGAFGNRAPAPLQGETTMAYRIRLAKGLQRHSAPWKEVSLRDLPKKALEIAEQQIYADASSAARNPNDVPMGSLREIRRKDAADRMITEFAGDPSAWMGEFRTAPRSITKPFFRPRQIGG